ncbi:NAD(P)-dependent oxidoreductase [Chryseobacterium sp. 6424]|uniref:glucose 1-dehydrogenase n=1 Tax=Chryseobacterium sp. 6424 TaxID=2039166 RepID=UPI000EFD4F60|nr:glucose 1-dehydrogenase [Chryseobacterium sp. 6424]AYO57803.1 NAD(P)-dependent oxidoreductase [Chryseobacterium sp. 6424]
MQKEGKEKIRPAQAQPKPGLEEKMKPTPESKPKLPGPKLEGKVAIITGGDSGIGKATALLFASHGADVAIAYLNETEDAKETQKEVEKLGQKCLLIKGDLAKEINCRKVIQKTVDAFGKINILVNNAGIHWEQQELTDISTEQLMNTFNANFFSVLWLTKYAMEYLKKGSSIINTTSVTAYRGSDHLMDYAATKGAILSFTRSLSANLAEKGIRVNAVAPGPIWTPLIASTLSPEDVAKFGSDTPMKRAGEPNEVATCFLFLASDDASYLTGQVLHPNGGEIIGG